MSYRRRSNAETMSRAGRYGLVVLLLAFSASPILWMLLSTVKLNIEIFSDPPVFIPQHIPQAIQENWEHALAPRSQGGLGGLKSIGDSAIIAVLNTLLVIVLAVPAAYSMARFKTGGKHFSIWIISQRILPPISLVLPYFLLFRELGLLDTHLGLILIYTTFNLPLAVWLLRGFFAEIPKEVEEAALIGGCSRVEALLRVTFPLALPGVAVTMLFCFIFAWNEFLFAVMLTRSRVITLPAIIPGLLYTGSMEPRFGPLFTLTAVSIFPILLTAFVLQKYVIRGLTFGAIKE